MKLQRNSTKYNNLRKSIGTGFQTGLLSSILTGGSIVKLGGSPRASIIGAGIGAGIGGISGGILKYRDLKKKDNLQKQNNVVSLEFEKGLPKEYFKLRNIVEDLRSKYGSTGLPQGEIGYLCPNILSYSSILSKSEFDGIDPLRDSNIPVIDLADYNTSVLYDLPDYIFYDKKLKSWTGKYIYEKSYIKKIPNIKKYLITLLDKFINKYSKESDISRESIEYMNLLRSEVIKRL